jgi:hypothetical protein
MSKVFVVQRPAFYDRLKRGWVNKYDLSPAEKFGDLVFLLRPGNIFRDRLDDAINQIESRMVDFNASEDHILAVGDPIAIAAAVMVASKISGGDVTVLKFDRQENAYQPYRIFLGYPGNVDSNLTRDLTGEPNGRD